MAHILERTAFATSRVLEFFTEPDLTTQIGYGRKLWPIVAAMGTRSLVGTWRSASSYGENGKSRRKGSKKQPRRERSRGNKCDLN